MAFKLLPGHPQAEPRLGWYEFVDPGIEFLDQLRLSNLRLDNYGKTFDEQGDRDRYSVHYSIPNPWAPAYLFRDVVQHPDHVLLDAVLEMILNLLFEYYRYDKLYVEKLRAPDGSSPFHVFWQMAPPFLKFGETEDEKYILMLRSKELDRVVGGVSSKSLVWASQSYRPALTLAELFKEEDLRRYLLWIRQNQKVFGLEEREFDVFWGHPKIRKYLEGGSPISDEGEKCEMAPWLMRKPAPREGRGPYFINNCYIFDESALRKRELFETGEKVPVELVEMLRGSRRGELLPLNYGAQKWILFDDMFSDGWIKLNSVTRSTIDTGPVVEANFARHAMTYYYAFLYPFKKSFLECGLDTKRLVRRQVQEQDGFAHSMVHLEIGEVELQTAVTGPVHEDNRQLAIWPPFPSRWSNVYVLERGYDYEAERIDELQFLDETGTTLEYELLRATRESRLYRIQERNRFPYYIVLKQKGLAGLLSLEPKQLEEGQGREFIVSLDFGSSHTNILYADKRTRSSIKHMLFDHSSPILITDEQNRSLLINEFVSLRLSSEPPTPEELERTGYMVLENWPPFRSLWRPFRTKRTGFLLDGVTSLSFSPEMKITGRTGFFTTGLKWAGEAGPREGFLRHILTRIAVECEALGATKVELRWARPMAFSTDETNAMKRFYDANLHKSFFENRGGYSEAICAKEYFLRKGDYPEFATEGSNTVTVDIGGGTADLTFFSNGKVQREDSVRFGGGAYREVRLRRN